MVNPALFEQFLQLDAGERREFVRAAQAAVDQVTIDQPTADQPTAEADVPEHVLAEVRRRLAEMGPEPATDYVTLEDDEREVRSRQFKMA